MTVDVQVALTASIGIGPVLVAGSVILLLAFRRETAERLLLRYTTLFASRSTFSVYVRRELAELALGLMEAFDEKRGAGWPRLAAAANALRLFTGELLPHQLIRKARRDDRFALTNPRTVRTRAAARATGRTPSPPQRYRMKSSFVRSELEAVISAYQERDLAGAGGSASLNRSSLQMQPAWDAVREIVASSDRATLLAMRSALLHGDPDWRNGDGAALGG